MDEEGRCADERGAKIGKQELYSEIWWGCLLFFDCFSRMEGNNTQFKYFLSTSFSLRFTLPHRSLSSGIIRLFHFLFPKGNCNMADGGGVKISSLFIWTFPFQIFKTREFFFFVKKWDFLLLFLNHFVNYCPWIMKFLIFWNKIRRTNINAWVVL